MTTSAPVTNASKADSGTFLNAQEREILNHAKLKIRALFHPLREKILSLIDSNKNEMHVTEVYVKLRIEQSVASQHLAILRTQNFVVARRDGKTIFYRVNHEEINRVLSIAKEI